MHKMQSGNMHKCRNAHNANLPKHEDYYIGSRENAVHGKLRAQMPQCKTCQKYKLAKCTNVQMHKMQTDKSIVKIVSMTKRATVNMS